MPVIGFLSVASPRERGDVAFRQGFADAGLIEGQNVAVEHPWAEGQYDRLPSFAAELVNRPVDLIFAHGAGSAVKGSKSSDLNHSDRILNRRY